MFSAGTDAIGFLKNAVPVLVLEPLGADYEKLPVAARKEMPTGEKCASILMVSVPRKGESIALGTHFYTVQNIQWIMADNKMFYPVLSVYATAC